MSVRVAVTGMSAWSAFGRGVPVLLTALAESTRAFHPVMRFATDSPWLRSRIAATAEDLAAAADPWVETIARAVDVADEAVAVAGIDLRTMRPSRIAVVNGTMHGTEGQMEFVRQRLAGASPDPRLLADAAAATARRIAARVGARGPNLTVSTACSSGLNAIGQAVRLVAGSVVDCAIAGGADIVNASTFAGFSALSALSPGGCRPLDEARDGVTLGDGAAYLVLEREDDAVARGADVLGFATGYAYAGEGYHMTASDPDGACAIRIMSRALAEDGAAGDLSLVVAHATGTPANDASEIRAVQEVVRRLGVLGPVDVCAMKSHFGHTLGAAGALEAVAALACMRAGMVPGTAGLSRPVAHEAPLRIPASASRRAVPLALCSSFGFGGSIAALCLRASANRV